MFYVEGILAAQTAPELLLRMRQDKDNVQVGTVLSEPLYGAHQHGTTAHRQKLLGQFGTHAQPPCRRQRL